MVDALRPVAADKNIFIPHSLTLHSGDQYVHCGPVSSDGAAELSLLLFLHGSCQRGRSLA